MNKKRKQMIKQSANGITLIALIITIIVMLILVAVSVTIAIKGDLFGTTKRAAKGTEKEKNLEQQLANGRVKIDEVWYDSFEDYVAGKPSEDQNESKIKFSYEPKGWTNSSVKVKIEVREIEGQLQYSMDGVEWTNYTEELEIKNNGIKIYARVMGSEEETETVVNKIDKESPSITTELSSPSQTTTSINVKIGVKDSISGISKIEWYYKNSSETEDKYTKLTEDKYAEINGENAGNRNEIKAEKTISGLEKGTTYNIKIVIYDVAGNKTESIVEAQTMASLVGKSATIDGQKYIVLYEPGEKIEIDGEEHELKDPQLISANVLEPDNVYLGYDDGQVDWTNADVISEADLDKHTTGLDDLEKAIYSYNHAIDTLNRKCESLVNMSNPDVVGVRSVGSNPVNPNSGNATTIVRNFRRDYAGEGTSLYKPELKDTDNNYVSDKNRMTTLNIINLDKEHDYWLGSYFCSINGDYTYGNVRLVRAQYGANTYSSIFTLTTSNLGSNGSDVGSGVRPVISIKSESLSKYLD